LDGSSFTRRTLSASRRGSRPSYCEPVGETISCTTLPLDTATSHGSPAVDSNDHAPALLVGIGLGGVLTFAALVVLVVELHHTVSEAILGALVGSAAAAAGLIKGRAGRVLRFGPAFAIAFVPALLLSQANLPSPVDAAKK